MFFFFNDTATNEIYTLSPTRRSSDLVQEGARAYLNRQYTVIAGIAAVLFVLLLILQDWKVAVGFLIGGAASAAAGYIRSEEHTSELQSRQYLVCRLLLEKKTKPRVTV